MAQGLFWVSGDAPGGSVCFRRTAYLAVVTPYATSKRNPLACSEPPEGHEHWTLRLMAGKVVELGLVSSLSHETVRLHLKKTPSSRGRSRSGASPR